MSQSSSRPYPISFLDDTGFLDHGAAGGLRDRPMNNGVTMSAIRDTSGATRWEARTASGATLRTFKLAMEPIQGEFAGPVVVPAEPGMTYVCYEDEAEKKSWCIKVRTD